ncbi:unnamed protein product [Prunus armeniaca]
MEHMTTYNIGVQTTQRELAVLNRKTRSVCDFKNYQTANNRSGCGLSKNSRLPNRNHPYLRHNRAGLVAQVVKSISNPKNTWIHICKLQQNKCNGRKRNKNGKQMYCHQSFHKSGALNWLAVSTAAVLIRLELYEQA